MSSVAPTAAATGVAGAPATPSPSPNPGELSYEQASAALAASGGSAEENQMAQAALDSHYGRTGGASSTPPQNNNPGSGGNVSVPPAVVPPPSNAPMSTKDFQSAVNAPDPANYASTTTGSSLSDTAGRIASLGLTSTQKSIDAIQGQREDQAGSDLTTERGNVSTIENALVTRANSTAAQDAIKAGHDQMATQLAQYQDIQNKIVAAQEALQMGLAYEGSQPERETLLQGRSAALQQQGLATIGALQGVASVIKGNIDLAQAYVTATVEAINKDNENSINALKTLLSLHEARVVSLTSQEKSIADDRIKMYTDQSNTLQKNADDVAELMTKYPSAFLAGGVTLTDTRQQALQKMLPKMAADERAKFNADLAEKYASIAEKRKSADNAKIEKAATTTLLNYKSKGMTYAEAVDGFADKIPVATINAIYGEDSAARNTTETDLYKNFINPDGSPKPGYSVGLDGKGKPTIQSADSSGPGFFSNLWSGITGAFSGS